MDRVLETHDSPTTAEHSNVAATSEGYHSRQAEWETTPEQSGIAEYARVLWRRKWIILGTMAVALVSVLGYCVLAGSTYSATATVLLEPPESQLFQQNQNLNPVFAVVNVEDAIQVIQSSTISHIVAKTIPNPPSIAATQVGTLQTTDVVQMTASDSDPRRAAAAANAYANAYISYARGITKATFEAAANTITNKLNTVQLAISNLNAEIRSTPPGVIQNAEDVQLGDLSNQQTSLENQLAQDQFYATQGQSTEGGSLITAATVPSSPSSPKTAQYVVLALIFGLIAGIGLALLVNSISRRRV